MAGPWEKYAQSGPWSRYAATPESPTDDMSTTDLVLAGAGKAVADLGRGIGQMIPVRRDGRWQPLVTAEDVAESRRLDKALMSTTAGAVGNVAGNVLALAPTAMIPGANTMTGATAIGGLAGLFQPSENMDETAANVLLGAGGGAAGQKIANKIAQVAASSGNATTQGQQAAARAGEKLGMRLTPGKASGSAALQKAEAALTANPMTSGGFDAIKQTNQRALNRAAAKAIGENADELSTPVLQRADARLGQVFDSVADQTPVPLDPMQVGGRLQQVLADSEGLIGGNSSLADNALFQRLDGFVNDKGGATREQLRALSSKLGKAARNNMTTPAGDRELGAALFRLQEVVEDAIEGSLSPAQRQTYGQAREQYRNLVALTAKTNVTNPSSGNVSGRGLATTLMQKDRGGFTLGGNTSDMYGAARFVQAFPDIVGDSGTATRSMGPADWLASIPTNALTSLYLSRPVTGAITAAGGAGPAAARALANPRNPLLRLGAVPAATTGGLVLADAFQ